MSEESDFVAAVSRLNSALETNSVENLQAKDFRVFINFRRNAKDIPDGILQEASDILLKFLSRGGCFCNDTQIVIATAFSNIKGYLVKESNEIFKEFLYLIKQDEKQECKIYLCSSVLQLNNHWLRPCESTEPLLQEIFKVIQNLCSELKSTTFFAFKVFYNLLQKIHQVHEENNGISAECLKTMLNIVMSNWENPLAGIRQQNSMILSQLLLFNEDIWKAVLPEPAEYDMSIKNFKHQVLLELVLSELSWAVKSKYFMLTAILQKCHVPQVIKNHGNEFVSGLKLSLSVPHLVSAGTDLYRTILAALSLPDWRNYFLLCITNIITNPKLSLELENMFSYWVPHTVKQFPESLQDLLGVSSLNVFSYISLLRLARKECLPGSEWESIDMSRIKSALECHCDKLRCQAFSLICTSSKTCIPPNEEEFNLISQFLKQNINSDNTSLRQSLLNSFTNIIIHIRDSLLYSLKSKVNVASKNGCFSFLDWLHSFLIENLDVSSNYQRKKTSLELYKILLNYFGEQSGKKENSYIRKSNKEHLSLKGHENTFSWKYTFDSEESRKVLISCLFDEDNDVRFSSATILISYFKLNHSDTEQFEDLFQSALLLCSSQIFYKAESGALILQVLVSLASSCPIGVFKDIICNGNSSFVSVLLSSAEKQLKCLQNDLLKAASQGSFLYGTLQTLNLLLTDPSSPEYMMLDTNQLERLIHLMEEVTKNFIGVLSSKSDPNSDYAPSFGEMGMAIAAVVDSFSLTDPVVELTVTDEAGGDLQLSPAQQLVLNCIWLNLKECCKLCSQLVSKPLSVADTERCVSVVVSVLCRCRHKGAIESAGLALSYITRHITSSSDPQLVALPAQLMDNFLQSVIGNTATTVSRRSAGLAILVHRLITGDSRPRKPLLHHCMSKLLNIAADTVTADDTTLVDLPQGQALHFLHTLVQESGLREHMAQYTLKISLITLNSLASPIWTIRNAALQLFGSLVPKLVGQKPHQEEGKGSHHLAFEELYSHAKPLVEMMLKEFSTAARSNSINLHSKLMPLLTLFVNLTAGLQTVLRDDIAGFVKTFQEHFQRLFNSKIFYVRKLSAKAHSLLLTFSQIIPMIDLRTQEVLDFISGKKSCIQSENALHGHLLNIKHLFQRFNEEKVGMKVLVKEEEILTKRLRILSQVLLLEKHSYFVKSLVFELKIPKNLLLYITKPSVKPKTFLAYAYFLDRQLACVILNLSDKEVEDLVEFCLVKQSDYDVQLACLKALKVLLKLNSVTTSRHSPLLFITLTNFVLCFNHSAEIISLTLELILCLLEDTANFPVTHNIDSLTFSKFLSFSFGLLFSNEISASIQMFLLPTVCGIMSSQNTTDFSDITKALKLIKDRTDSSYDQDIRTNSAKSMFLIIPALNSQIITRTESGELIWEACVDFLQDEIAEVRHEASKFVTAFFSKPHSSVWNPSISLENLFKYSFITRLMLPDQAFDCLWARMVYNSTTQTTNFQLGISNPFDHGMKSIYAEEKFVSKLAYNGILELTKSCKEELIFKIKETCSAFSNKEISSTSLEYVNKIKNTLNTYV